MFGNLDIKRKIREIVILGKIIEVQNKAFDNLESKKEEQKFVREPYPFMFIFILILMA